MAARNHIRNVLFDILRQLESGNNSSDTLDHVQYRIDCLYEIILRCFDTGFVGESFVTVVREALDCFKLNDNDVMYKARKVFTGRSGRPRYNISREQLEFLVQKRFSTAEIAVLLAVGKHKRTAVERRLEEFHLSIRATYSDMFNEELDAEITSIFRIFPNTGYKRMTGFLLSRNVRIQQQRIREAMRRVNPEGTLLRGR